MDLNNAGDLYEDIFIKNRILNVQNTCTTIYAKLREIFRYEGLPLTLPKRILEGLLLRNGSAVVYEFEGELFVTDQLPGTKANIYDENTEVQVMHNVGPKQERFTRTIGVDAVLVRNDSECFGVDNLVTEFAIFTAQGKITILENFVNLRNPYVIQAKDENSRRSALEYERAIRRGDNAIILAEEFDTMEGMVVHSTPVANNQATQAIELYQYVQSLYYSEFGISLNNNMKREYVSDSEIEKSSGMPLIYNMLASRLEALRDIKALFGVDITISLSSEWDDEKEADSEPEVGSEGEEPGEAAGAAPGEEPEGGEPAEPEGEAEDAAGEEDPEAEGVVEPEPEPELEEVTAEELIEATEAMLGEEVEHDEEADGDPAADDADPEPDAGEDEGERPGVEAEEDDDEGR